MKKIVTIFLSAVMLVTSACASENEVNEGVVGESQKTYREFVYTLPFLEEGDTIQDFCQLSDGKWAVWTSDNRLFTTQAGENEWTQTDYEESGWYEEREEKWISTRLSPDGARISYCIDREQTEEGDNFLGEQKIDYLYVGADGKTAVQSNINWKDEQIGGFYLSDDGRLFCNNADNKIYEVEPETGEKTLLLENTVFSYPFFMEGTMLVPDINGMSFYDLEKGEQLPQNEVLDKFLKEKAANLNQGMFYVTADREGNLYFLLEDGFYRYLEDGSVVEQVFDANITEKGSMGTYSCLDICIDGGEKFQMFYGDGSRRVYGAHIVREPDVILTIYRLQEEQFTDLELHMAIKQYETLHPEVRIEFETGMKNQSAGVTKEDAIKNLNLELAAGTGPDLLILGGLPTASYMQQGILADISSVVNRVDEEDGLVPQVVEHYYEEDGSVYRIPLGFTINVMIGPEEILGEEETVTLRELADGFAGYYAEEEHIPRYSGQWWVIGDDGGDFLYGLIRRLAPACMDAWLTEENKLDEEAITEFLLCVKQIQDVFMMQQEADPRYVEYEAQNPGTTVLDWACNVILGKDEIISRAVNEPCSPHGLEIPSVYKSDNWDITFNSMGPAQVGSFSNRNDNSTERMLLAQCDFYESEIMAEWKVFDGQTQHTFNPMKTIGVVQKSKNREAAEDFLEFLLRDDVTANESLMSFSTNQRVLLNNLESMTEHAAFINGTVRIREEYVDRVKVIIEELERPSPDNAVLLDAVAQEGCYYLMEDCTVEEAVEQIKKRMELYMAE